MVFLSIICVYQAYTRRYVIMFYCSRARQWLKRKLCSPFLRAKDDTGKYKYFVYITYEEQPDNMYVFSKERIEDYLKKKFGCKVFNKADFCATNNEPNLRFKMQKSENLIVVVSERFIEEHRFELREILTETQERGNDYRSLIVVAREHLPNMDDNDLRQLLALASEPIVWRDYTDNSPNEDRVASVDMNEGRVDSYRLRKRGWTSNMVHDRKRFYQQLEDRLFGGDDVMCCCGSRGKREDGREGGERIEDSGDHTGFDQDQALLP